MGGVRVSWQVVLGSALALGCAGSAGTSQALAPAPAPAPVQRSPAQARGAQVETLLASGHAFAGQKRGSEAELQFRQAIKLAYGFSEPWTRYRAEALTALAHCLLKAHRAAEARDAVDQALALTKPGAIADDQRIAELQVTKAESFRVELAPLAAVEPFTAAVDAASRHPSELATPLVRASLKLAETLEGLGRHQAATKTLERALEIAKQSPEAAPFAARIAQALAAIYDKSGEPQRARELLAKYPVDGEPGENATAPAATKTNPAAAKAGGESAAQELASMQADFRACYQESLEDDYEVEGKVQLIIHVAADGRVANVKAAGLGLPRATVDCLVRRAAVARFDPPQGGSATITVPVTFVKQD